MSHTLRMLIGGVIVAIIATPVLSQQPNVQQIKEVVKACVEAVNAGGGVGQSDAYYNAALHGVQVGVATAMWKFKFSKCMAEHGVYTSSQ